MRNRKHGQDEDLEFQIAPMVDVLLVILIFFVSITSASSMRADRNITLPVASNGKNVESAMQKGILNLTWDNNKKAGIVTVDNVVFADMAELTAVLAPKIQEQPTYRVLIRGDHNVPAFFIQRVMTACGEAGVFDINFSVVNRN